MPYSIGDLKEDPSLENYPSGFLGSSGLGLGLSRKIVFWRFWLIQGLHLLFFLRFEGLGFRAAGVELDMWQRLATGYAQFS